MVSHLGLADLLPDLRHEGPMELAAELAWLEVLAVLGLRALILSGHVVHDLVEDASLAKALPVLGNVLAAVHFRLVQCEHAVGVRVAPHGHGGHGHVIVHEPAVPAQVHSPDLGPERVLRDALVATLAHKISGAPVLAMPHVEGALQQLRARLARARRAERVGVVKVVQVLRAHRALVVLEELVRVLLAQELQHLLRAEGGRVGERLVHALRDVAPLLDPLLRLVRVPLGDIPAEEVHNVVDFAGHRAARHPAGLAQSRRLRSQSLRAHVEARRPAFPHDVVKVHHGPRGGPFVHGDVGVGLEERHHDGLQHELQTRRAVPSHEEGVLVHEFAALAPAQRLVVLDALHLGDDTDDPIPVVPLGSERAEEAGYVTERRFAGLPRLDLDLPHHGEDQLPQLRLASLRARDVRRVADHLLRQAPYAHAGEVLRRVARRLRVVPDVPLLRAQGLGALDHIHPPVHECHVRLREPALGPQYVRPPEDEIHLLMHEVVGITRLVLEQRREGPGYPEGLPVRIPDSIVQLRGVHQRLVGRRPAARRRSSGGGGRRGTAARRPKGRRRGRRDRRDGRRGARRLF